MMLLGPPLYETSLAKEFALSESANESKLGDHLWRRHSGPIGNRRKTSEGIIGNNKQH